MTTYNFFDQGMIKKWNLSSLAWANQQNCFYMVGAEGNVFTITNEHALPTPQYKGNIGNWNLKMLTFDKNGNMFGVGADGNMGKWQNGSWSNEYDLGGWVLEMIAFDHNNTLWAVGANGNVGKWDGYQLQDQGNLDGWSVNWIAFDDQNPGQILCV